MLIISAYLGLNNKRNLWYLDFGGTLNFFRQWKFTGTRIGLWITWPVGKICFGEVRAIDFGQIFQAPPAAWTCHVAERTRHSPEHICFLQTGQMHSIDTNGLLNDQSSIAGTLLD